MSTGVLRVRIKSSSMFLGHVLPFEIRDTRHRLVRRGDGLMPIKLAEGLYSVEATLPDGKRDSQVVQIEAGGDATLTFEPSEPVGDSVRSPSPAYSTVAGSIQVESTFECEVRESSDLAWCFGSSTHDPASTPSVNFSVDGERVAISMPVNVRSTGPESACAVTALRTSSGVRFKTTFDDSRTVSVAVEGLIRSGEVVRGTSVIEQASYLLLDKYQDPPGAAIGALTLHRLGHLRERQGWLENLARDFPWIPDGRVLLAALLAHDGSPAEQARGYKALISASKERPMFTDGLSLMLELLRRWPDANTWDERRERLDELSLLIARADLNELVLSEYEELAQ